MPFSITTQPFGPLPLPTDREPLTEYVLQSTGTGEFVSILPGFGGIARRLVLRKASQLYALLNAPDSPQALLADESYASALLFPFPSRVRHGIYTFEGSAYALHMNESSRDNALHGFVHGQSFAVVGQETATDHASLTLRYTYGGDAPGYPFPFDLTVTYELTRADWLALGSNPTTDRMCALRMTYEALNTGTTRCPVAFGWHPYFTFTSDPIDELTLSLPARTPILLNSDMIPMGRQPRVEASAFDLRDRQLDTAFAIEPTGTSATGESFAETILTSSTADVRLIVGQQTGEGRLNYLVCYTPTRRDSIAIEPETANVNAFNNGEGLVVLNPGERLTGSIWVRLD